MRRSLSTRLLLTLAAIGIAGGILMAPVYLFATPLGLTFPLAYAALQGVGFIPGAFAQRLLRRPGVAVLTVAIVGLLCSVTTPWGFSLFLPLLSIGIAQELPFLVTLYRHWGRPVFLIGAATIGAGNGALFFTAFGAGDLAPVIHWLIIPVSAASVVAGTALVIVLADRVALTGVARGLQPSERAAPQS